MKRKTADMINMEMACIPVSFHKPFNSMHEGFAVLQEEVLELQKEMFWGARGVTDEMHRMRVREEAVQVAAMAVRIIQELT